MENIESLRIHKAYVQMGSDQTKAIIENAVRNRPDVNAEDEVEIDIIDEFNVDVTIRKKGIINCVEVTGTVVI